MISFKQFHAGAQCRFPGFCMCAAHDTFLIDSLLVLCFANWLYVFLTTINASCTIQK